MNDISIKYVDNDVSKFPSVTREFSHVNLLRFSKRITKPIVLDSYVNIKLKKYTSFCNFEKD